VLEYGRSASVALRVSPCGREHYERKRSLKKLGLVLVAIAAALLVAAPAFGASWHKVKSKSLSGEFAVTAFNATVRHPRAMKIQLRGAIDNVMAVVACSRGFTVSSYSRSYSGSGTYKLPIRPRRAGSCQVTVSFGVSGGSGRATLYVYR
jgi:hypothetical protein